MNQNLTFNTRYNAPETTHTQRTSNSPMIPIRPQPLGSQSGKLQASRLRRSAVQGTSITFKVFLVAGARSQGPGSKARRVKRPGRRRQ
jgi:hypothetical protein